MSGMERIGELREGDRRLLLALVDDKFGSGRLLYITELATGRRSSILIPPELIGELAETMLALKSEGRFEKADTPQFSYCDGCRDTDWRTKYMDEHGVPLPNHEGVPDTLGYCVMCAYPLKRGQNGTGDTDSEGNS